MLDVGETADIIADGEILDGVIQRVDREIATNRILLDAAVDVVAHQPVSGQLALAAAVVATGPEGRHLDDLPTEMHVRQPEPTPDQTAVSEQLLDLLRSRVGGDVEILRLAAYQQVAHGATDQEGAVAGFLEAIKYT